MFQDRIINNYIFNTRNVLGKGYSGTVYVGNDSQTSKKVAIKVIKKDFIDKNEKMKLALDNEVLIMKQMNSKNIVKLLDTFESQNNYYLILEYCEQGDLRQYLRKNRVLPELLAKDILIQILQGYKELIKSGIIHRDLKPANILISNKCFKLADFGFSKIIKKQDQMLNSYVGTPVYMSPQILTEANYSQKCDIWSLGIIYYECLFGCYPWNMENSRIIDEIVKNKEIVFPKYTSVSKLSQEFIHQCLQFAECDRIDWNRVFSHPLFQNRIKDISNSESNIKYFITQLRELVLKQEWTTNMLFSLVAINKNQINVQTLHRFLQTLNKNLTFSDTIEIFKQMDINNRNIVNLTEFKLWFDKINPYNEINPFKQQLRPSLTELQKSEQTIKNLNQKIQQLQIDPIQLFQKFDKQNTMTLDKNGIRELSLSIDPTLEENELETIYLYFDLNKNHGKICGWEYKELFKDDTELDENQIIQLQPSLSGPGEKLSKL